MKQKKTIFKTIMDELPKKEKKDLENALSLLGIGTAILVGGYVLKLWMTLGTLKFLLIIFGILGLILLGLLYIPKIKLPKLKFDFIKSNKEQKTLEGY